MKNMSRCWILLMIAGVACAGTGSVCAAAETDATTTPGVLGLLGPGGVVVGEVGNAVVAVSTSEDGTWLEVLTFITGEKEPRVLKAPGLGAGEFVVRVDATTGVLNFEAAPGTNREAGRPGLVRRDCRIPEGPQFCQSSSSGNGCSSIVCFRAYEDGVSCSYSFGGCAPCGGTVMSLQCWNVQGTVLCSIHTVALGHEPCGETQAPF